MRQLFGEYFPFIFLRLDVRSALVFRGIGHRLLAPILALATFSTGSVISAQTANQITYAVDNNQVQVLQNHHPLWASSVNDIGVVPPNQMLNQLTMVLTRSPQQEQAFEQFLADQQDPASPDYHHWLTPDEVGTRFGLSDQDIDTLTGWLQSRGLHVNWIAPSRTFIGFGGASADVGRAFQTELRYYKVDGEQHMSVSSDPVIPEALLPAITAIRGLYTIDEHALNHKIAMRSVSPEYNFQSSHFLGPYDFDIIYDVPYGSMSGSSAAGQTIGIVSWSRTSFADFNSFRNVTEATFANPTEVIPVGYGGVDPGPAAGAGGVATDGQDEATLDVTRAGSVAQDAKLLLVASSRTGSNDALGSDAQYLVQTSPVPAQIITISFGACESAAGSSGVTYWDSLFQQAAAEGISVFVSSGDSGASGCDKSSATPPTAPAANSINYICSSGYATCVGGTEFNDVSDPSLYWRTGGSLPGLRSALGYIPEGAWDEPLDSNSDPTIAGSGGGVSKFIATPSWQTGTGVPAARAGRYTPDVSFSSSGHDGYFICYAVVGGSCATAGYFAVFSGTSAAAPGMAGIAALLNAKMGSAQGNLNPQLYQMQARSPSAFHDVTVASSGVTSCSVNIPSMCNNSAPGSYGLSGGQAGFLVTTGYDEVTGLGSLDVANFVNAWASTPGESATATPVFHPAAGTYSSAQNVTITDTTAGATIYYTTNGTTPTTGSTVYSGPITVSSTEIVKAIATANGYSTSAEASAAYTINPLEAATPTFSPAAGSYTTTQTVTISDATVGAHIYYTTDGTTPTTGSTAYSSPITVSSTEMLEAIATASGYTTSPVASASYTISNPANPVPMISSMSPAYTSAGGTAFTLTINGSKFATGSTVYWGTSALATQYVSATQLTARVPAASIATAGTTTITVQTPAPGGGTSNSLQFEVDSTMSGTTSPSFTSLTATVAAGSTATYPVTLSSTATNVTATCLNLPTGASCSYSSATNAMTITTSSSTPKGTYQVTVVFTETMPGAAAAGILLPTLLFPLVFIRRKLAARGIWFTACLGLLLMTGAAFFVGCGGGGSGSTTTSPTNPTHQVTSSGAVSLTIQ